MKIRAQGHNFAFRAGHAFPIVNLAFCFCFAILASRVLARNVVLHVSAMLFKVCPIQCLLVQVLPRVSIPM